jgi:RNA polymerase sigma factor (sigma-70 family)
MSAEASPPARLVIADDHALVREGMRAMLAKEADLRVVGEAENGREAVELCRDLHPDLVLMDVRMPEMDGLKATRAIKEECPQTSVLVVTTHESPEYLLDAIKAGAAGYVLKEATKQQLLKAVRGVLSGESPLNQELAMRLIKRLVGEVQREIEQPPPPEEVIEKRREEEPLLETLREALTDRELEALRLLTLGKTNREIAEDLRVSLSTVKNHVQHIIVKLEVSDRTQAAVRAVELGLLPNQE